ncbi:MAG: V-type ATP synthase subunit I, partial [Alistipes sp.]|nr:V-type ATP synthase subunit I [Alistipes sp.]
MISKMIRYDIVLHVGEQEHFIDKLREIGLVDITTTGWEPSEKDRQRLLLIDSYRKAIESLEAFRSSSDFDADAADFETGAEAYDAFVNAEARRAEIAQRIAALEKQAHDIAPWGSFSKESIDRLKGDGVQLRFFIAQPAAFAQLQAEAEEGLTVVEINRTQSSVYFVAIATAASQLTVDGQEVNLPESDYAATLAQIEELKSADKALNSEFSRSALSLAAIKAQRGALMEELQGVQVGATAQREADGQLLVMEGWAEAVTAERVDKLLENYPNLVYMRRDATIDDEAPVKLKNNKFASLFELIGSMYALPKYGTLDLTAIFGPFYMLFFAICLCDAG